MSLRGADAEGPWAQDPVTGRLVHLQVKPKVALNIGKQKVCLQLFAHLGF